MTITEVNGHSPNGTSMVGRVVEGQQVVADDLCETALSTPERRVYFKRIRKLTLADGVVVHACTECDYVRPHWNQVRPHLSKHSEGRPALPAIPPVADEIADMRVGDLLEIAKRVEVQARHIDRLIDEVSGWKTRAQDAERRLAAMRRALAPN